MPAEATTFSIEPVRLQYYLPVRINPTGGNLSTRCMKFRWEGTPWRALPNQCLCSRALPERLDDQHNSTDDTNHSEGPEHGEPREELTVIADQGQAKQDA
jgi:hypothetical protein